MPFAACKDIEWTRDGLRDTGLDVTAMPCGVCPDDYDQVVASIHQTGTSWTRWFPRLMKLHATLHACKEQGFLSYETPLCVVKLGLGAHMKTAFAMTTHARLGSRSGGAGLDSLVLNMIFEAAEEDHVDRDEYEKKVNVLRWWRMHVSDAASVHSLIQKMVASDRELWTNSSTESTWGVYELLRRMGAKPSIRASAKQDPGKIDMLYYKMWTTDDLHSPHWQFLKRRRAVR